MNTKIDELLITGATGQTAKYFFERLKAENYSKKIRCLVRKETQIASLNSFDLDLDLVTVDFEDVESLRQAMIGAKTVLHIAHVHLSEKIIEAGNAVGVDWFICVHTTGRYSKFKSASARYIEIEERILKSHDNVTILRPTLIYGSELDRNFWRVTDFLHRYRVFPVFGSGKNLLQPVNAEDLGNAYYDVIRSKTTTFGKQYDLSGRDVVTYLSIVKEIARLLNKDVFFLHLPLWFSLFCAYLMNSLLGSSFPIKVEQVQRMKEDKVFSHQRATEDFGYNPIGFELGIRREVEEFRSVEKGQKF